MTRLGRHRQLSPSERAREVRVQDLIGRDGGSPAFSHQKDIWLEVGTGKDTHILERSLHYPSQIHIGIEQTRKKFEMMLRKAETLDCGENLKLLHADAAVAVNECFPAESIAGIFLLFPDPWPKDRHARRRLLQSVFLAQLATKLRPGAPLEIRTDDSEYAEQAHQCLLEIDSIENRIDGKPWLDSPLDPEHHIETIFELRFRAEGKPIHYFYLKKKEDARFA
ncbi:MAG: tRNA (guanosine(46)-N7)-methyltransferase TrmB [Planctomycetota bacterium]